MALAKSVLIIGGGFAGLSAGIFGQRNGLQTTILEMHSLPGGLCTSWQRKEYCFDGCVHYVYGSGKGQTLYPLMEKIGAAGGRAYMHHAEVTRVETTSGQTVIFHSNEDLLEQHLLDISPDDAETIHNIAHAIRSIKRVPMPSGPPRNLTEAWDMARGMVYFVPHFQRWSKVPLKEFAFSLKSAVLQEAFLHYYEYADRSRIPMFFLLYDLAQHAANNAGWPVGGSLALARDVEKRYLSLGGQLRYRTKVESLLLEGDRVVGLRDADGQEHRADAVIAAADGHTVLYSMLGGRYLTPEFSAAYDTADVISPIIQVSLGVTRNLAGTPSSINVPLEQPIDIGGISYPRFTFTHHSFDPSMAPAGKSTVIVNFETSYEAWHALSRNREKYNAEKESAAQQVIDRLDKRMPGFRSQVEVVDVATPLTYENYTGNWRGYPQGWVATTKTALRHLPNRLPGLAGFYMAGQWVQVGGGLPGGAMSGHKAAKLLCRDFKMPFKD